MQVASDRVAIAMTNRPEFLEALFAIWHAGLVAVPMNAKLHSDEFGYIIGNTEAALTLASPDRADDVAPHGRTIATGSERVAQLVPRRRHRHGAARPRAISPGCFTPAARPAGRRAPC